MITEAIIFIFSVGLIGLNLYLQIKFLKYLSNI
jgi:hypothetical protein